MLDHDDAHAKGGVQVLEHAHEAALAVRFQAGQHFIEQQQFRIGGQRLGHLQRLQFRQRQFAGRVAPGLVKQARKIEDFIDLAQVDLAGAEALRHDEVFAHRQFMHRLRDLEGAAQSQACALVHGRGHDVASLEADAAAGGAHQAGNGVEQGGLAGAVRAHEADHVVAAYF